MDPSAAGVAGIRGLGSVASAVLTRFKPVGVARCGSPEDRAPSYRRLLDAVVETLIVKGFIDYGHEHVPEAPDSDLMNHFTIRLPNSYVELYSALYSVQLCAPSYVIDAAVDLVKRVASDEPNEEAQAAFLNAARHDLNYNPKRWNLMARRKEKKFRARQVEHDGGSS